MSKFIVLVTGASSGIGKACADHLALLDCTVYGASRTSEIVSESRFLPLDMNVNQGKSVKQGVEHILDQERQIDVVVNCAGFGIAGSVEDTTIAQAKAQFETNFFGTVRVCQAVLPAMRQQGEGLIVNISSLGGLLAIPFQSFYSASKFAIEGLIEALRLEVAPFGIRVVLIQPGNFHTGFTAKRQIASAARSNPAYQQRFEKSLAQMEKDEINGPAPTQIAQLLGRIIRDPNPPLRYPAVTALERFFLTFRKFAPFSLYERAAIRVFQLE